MTGALAAPVAALNARCLRDFPREAARGLERETPEAAMALLLGQGREAILSVWSHLSPDTEEQLFALLPEEVRRQIVTEGDPTRLAGLLLRLHEDSREEALALAPESVAKELRGLLRYDPDTAGHLMDPRIAPPRVDATVDEALAKLRALRQRARREIFAIDEEGRLAGRVEIQDLALADPAQPLRDLIRPVVAAVNDLAPREEIVEKLEGARLSDLPVVDIDGRLIGVLADSAVLSAIQEEATIDIQKMFGASGDERSLSSPLFAVRKRLPWLQVNLLTAFAAAAVIAMFQGLINVYPTLAVLMGVVAGQSGNAGAQSLAVTMRGLALREIGIRHWPRVVFKESSAGFMNGLAVAATTSIAVFLIYRSAGLAIIIASAMIIAMVAAGFSGALIPITMRRFGLDPAQSSSIVLTTVTDVTSFLSFLGIASILAPMI